MINHVTLHGRFTDVPQLGKTNSGKSVCSFTLAVDRLKREDPADFINCVAWERTAEFVNNYFHKGQMAIVSGRGQNEEFTDREGNKVKMFEIQAANVYFGSAAKAEVGETKFTEIPDDGEELPF